MAITMQRHVAQNTAISTSHTVSVQVDTGTDTGIIVWVDPGSTSATSVAYNGVSLTSLGGNMWYLTVPATGTNDLTYTTAIAQGTRNLVWVLDGVHQTNAPAYLAGTNAAPVSWSWTGRTVGDFIACAASRQGTPTWSPGGGLAEDSEGTFTRFSTITRVAAGGSLIADATSESPTFAFTGGDSATNSFGSVSWSEASPSGPTPTPAFGRYGVRGPVR